MGYRSLIQCVNDLESAGHLVRLVDKVDAHLEVAEIHRRVHRSGGPAILFENVNNCDFPMVSNLFGTLDRAEYMFRDSLTAVKRLVELKVDPRRFWKQPTRLLGISKVVLNMLPRQERSAPVLKCQTSIAQLPQLKSWPDDGGAYITLGAIYSEDVNRPGHPHSNLGMYRVQLSGNSYKPNQEVGLHYQIHRGIGVHHSAAIASNQPFRVNIFVGGSPAMALAAVMPLPEGMSELKFAGAMAGHRIPLVTPQHNLPIYAEADFCITGTVQPGKLLPEGPFGDHLGYYSLAHDFPVMNVHKVYHRKGAIWPFTVVGRPPQEDTAFGQLIHEITGPIIPTLIAGVRAVHAVDATGVHPLLLAIGSERYTPYQQETRPQEVLTQANALLGQGQLSLAKYLLIVSHNDQPSLDIHNVSAFLQHLLCRVDWTRDLHFQTATTIDTLDYSGSGLNAGSKVVIAGVGPPVRELPTEIPSDLTLPDGFGDAALCLPGVLAISGPPGKDNQQIKRSMEELTKILGETGALDPFPLLVIVDDSTFASKSLNNFLWVTFTRSNPAADIYGVDSFSQQKHWGCHGPLLIDARRKPHHAPPLVEDPEITRRVDALAARGGPLSAYL